MEKIALCAFLLACVLCVQATTNVLFISVDDLRPEFGAYGFSHVHTDNMNELASNATVFKFAYCQMSACSPSRASAMTGRRPERTRVYDLKTYFRNSPDLPDVVTLPQYFKNNGYRTAGMGKIFHQGVASGGDNDAISWTDPYFSLRKDRRFKGSTHSWVASSEPEDEFPDALLAQQAVVKLQELKQEKFFLAVGFLKPHLPFIFPDTYLPLYPESSIGIAANADPPVDIPREAWNNYAELRGYSDIDALSLSKRVRNAMPDDKAKELRRAYWATMSHVDKQIGVVLKALKDNNLSENTTVVLWSDHGWHLGNHGLWAKSTNFEAATRSTLVIRAPHVQDSLGTEVTKVVEHLDLYPTLLDLANLPAHSDLEGSSMVPLMKGESAGWKNEAFSQTAYKRATMMGYTIRTPEYRYTEWLSFNKRTNVADWDNVISKELYSHDGDDGESYSKYENVNLASSGLHTAIVEDLSRKLCAQTTTCTRSTSP